MECPRQSIPLLKSEGIYTKRTIENDWHSHRRHHPAAPLQTVPLEWSVHKRLRKVEEKQRKIMYLKLFLWGYSNNLVHLLSSLSTMSSQHWKLLTDIFNTFNSNVSFSDSSLFNRHLFETVITHVSWGHSWDYWVVTNYQLLFEDRSLTCRRKRAMRMLLIRLTSYDR